LGLAVPIAAVACGACIIEKHFTLSRKESGPDSAFSLEPSEFKAMVEAVRTAEKALGNICYEITEKQMESRALRRSLFVVSNMKAGQTFTSDTVRSVRPANGLHTRYLGQVLGKKTTTDIEKGTPLTWDMIALDDT
jgi:N-acetylneuraminate synthase